MKKIATTVSLDQWRSLPPGARFSAQNKEGLRVNLLRQADSLLVEAEASLQHETEMSETIKRHEEQTAQSLRRQTGGWFEQPLVWIALGVALGVIIFKQIHQ